MACCLVACVGCCLMGKEMKRAVKPEAELPPEFDPRNDAEAQESKWRSKNMQRSQAARQQTKSPAVQEAIARRSALQRSGASGKKGSGNGRNGSGKR